MKASLKPLMSSASQDWATPLSVFQPLNDEFGFTLDVCATSDNAKCSRFFSPEGNGLNQSWRGEIAFMNPPYGRPIGKWIEKAFLESRQPDTTVVCLIPARTDTKWWHNFVIQAAEIRFKKGRIKFVRGASGAALPSFLSSRDPAFVSC